MKIFSTSPGKGKMSGLLRPWAHTKGRYFPAPPNAIHWKDMALCISPFPTNLKGKLKSHGGVNPVQHLNGLCRIDGHHEYWIFKYICLRANRIVIFLLFFFVPPAGSRFSGLSRGMILISSRNLIPHPKKLINPP